MDTIKKRLQELNEEANHLVNKRETFLKQIKDIETRLTQLVGAISELDKLKGDKHADGEARQPSVSQSSHEAESAGATDKGSEAGSGDPEGRES
jgi:prefoldin subunit 5